MSEFPDWCTRKNLTRAAVGVVAIGVVGAAAVLFFGAVNTSARPPHWKLTTAFLHQTFKASVSARADAEPPTDFGDQGRVVLGAQHYENVCSKCHGGPGLGQNPIALSMRPRPQHLAAVVDQFTDPELFYILQNGVRFSAMPAWPTLQNNDEIWSVVAFLRQLPEMSAEDYATLVAATGDAPVMPYGTPGPLAETDVGVKAPPLDEYNYSAPATEWADIAFTGQPVARCAACHGTDGTGAPTEGHAPNLTMQSASYLSDSLHAYATGDRKSGIMQVIAAGLSENQITALSDYYSSMPDTPTPVRATASMEMITEGETLAREGQPDQAVAPCLSCHEKPMVEGGVQIPRLAGQSATYLSHQLQMFSGEGRGMSGIYNPMGHQAGTLSDEDIANVSAYFASLPPTGPEGMEDGSSDADLANGSGIVERVCSECHTATGVGVASGQQPNLTLQTKDYLTQQLHSFRAGQRENSQMFQTTSRLENSDINDVAAYFGQIPPQPSPGTVDQALADAGETIAMNGVSDAGVPSCLTCHGAEQTAATPLVARLHGQNATYLKNRLDYFAEGNGDQLPGLNPMHSIASGLTSDQRAEVANWFASQDALPKAP